MAIIEMRIYKMEKTTDLVLFNSSDGKISLPVAVNNETVWLTLDQISALFQRDKSTISRHIRNVFQENELERDATVAKFATVQLLLLLILTTTSSP